MVTNKLYFNLLTRSKYFYGNTKADYERNRVQSFQLEQNWANSFLFVWQETKLLKVWESERSFLGEKHFGVMPIHPRWKSSKILLFQLACLFYTNT